MILFRRASCGRRLGPSLFGWRDLQQADGDQGHGEGQQRLRGLQAREDHGKLPLRIREGDRLLSG